MIPSTRPTREGVGTEVQSAEIVILVQLFHHRNEVERALPRASLVHE